MYVKQFKPQTVSKLTVIIYSKAIYPKNDFIYEYKCNTCTVVRASSDIHPVIQQHKDVHNESDVILSSEEAPHNIQKPSHYLLLLRRSTNVS